MKKIIIAALLTALSLPAFAQASSEFGLKTVKFARNKNMVDVEFTMDVDGRKMHTTEQWTITPVIRSGNTEEKLAPITIAGNNQYHMLVRDRKLNGLQFPEDMYRVRRRDAMTITYKESVPYQEWMRNATLDLDERCELCKAVDNYTDNMGRIANPEPYKMVPSPAFVTPKQEQIKERNIAATAFIDFPVNQTTIRRDYRSNPAELEKIRKTLDDVKANRDLTFKGVQLHGYASPEGSYSNNERLATGRVQALKNYVASNFSVPANSIVTAHTAEDWAGLKALIEKSSIAGKSELLSIVNSSDAPDTKEARMKAVQGGAPWRVILAEMMPGLRRTDYRVDFTVREYNLADSREMLEKNPSLLSHYELDMLAREYGANTPQYNRIYGLIETQFPTSDDANMNVAAYKISKGDYAGAKVNLARVTAKNAAYYTNLGIAEMMTGNYNAAQQAFRQAGNNPDAQRNLRELEKFLETNVK